MTMMDTPLDITRALKVSSEGCPRIGDDHPVVLIIPGYAPWKQISNLFILASTQLGNTPRIENTGSTSWKPLHSSSGWGLLVMMMMMMNRMKNVEISGVFCAGSMSFPSSNQ